MSTASMGRPKYENAGTFSMAYSDIYNAIMKKICTQ